MSEFRFCKLFEKEVLLAPKRLKKELFEPTIKVTKTTQCVFDRGFEDKTPKEVESITKEGSWSARVVPNLFNALSLESPINNRKDGYNEKKEGFGVHDVVIETPHHDKDFFSFTKEEFYDYFCLVQKRVLSLQKDGRLEYIKVFKNHGTKAGASMEHSHSQIIATNHALKEEKELLQRQKEYFKLHGRTLLSDIIYEEIQEDKRVIINSENFLLYCPYAPQFGYEVIVVAKEDKSDIKALQKSHLQELSTLFTQLFKSYKTLFGNLDFNLLYNTQTLQKTEDTNFFIRITPRFTMLAGFELLSGVHINPFLPEEAAKNLKQNL